MYRTGINERRAFTFPKRKLTERKIVDEQGTREGCITRKLYHIFSGVDFSVIGPLDFINVPHS
jgi:hypothetical protein